MSGTSDVPVVPRPKQVTAAVVVVAAAAVLNAVIGCYVVSQIPAVRAAWIREASTASAGPDPTVFIVALALVAFLYAAGLVVCAALFHAGRPRARVVLFSLTLLSLFALVPPNYPAAAVVLLLLVADVLLYRSPVSAWVRNLRGLRAA